MGISSHFHDHHGKWIWHLKKCFSFYILFFCEDLVIWFCFMHILPGRNHTPSHMNNNCFSYDEIFNPWGSNKFLQTNNLKKFISVHDHHGKWIWHFKDHTLSFAKSTPFDFLAEWSFDKRMIQTPWKKIWFEVVGVMMLQIIIYIYLFIF